MSAHPLVRRVAAVVLAVAVGWTGSWLGLTLLSDRTFSMGPFRVRLSSAYGRGVTDIAILPLGRVTADTHRAPLHVTATLQSFSVNQLTNDVREGGIDQLVSDVQKDALASIGAYAAWAFGAAMIGAIVLSLLAFRRNVKLVLIAVLAAFVAIGGTEVSTYATFRPSAFLSPKFSGSLALAPRLVGPVRQATNRIEDFRAELEQILDGAVRAYTAIPPATVDEGPQLRVLHISDIHLNPLGLDFAKQVADGFDVNFVVDTGDLTSFGTPAEQLILSRIPAIGRPYVFVRGNHDSMALQEAMTKVPNARVLDGNSIRLSGFTIYGLGDPAFTPNKESAIPDAVVAQLDRQASDQIAQDLDAAPKPPDIVVVHDGRMAESAAGRVPLVLSGHFHRTADRVADGTLFLRVGSTGGTGATVFTRNLPLTAEVLYFTTSTPSPTLVAWDVVQQSPQTGSFTVQRHLVAQEFPTAGQFPAPTPTAPASPTPSASEITPAPSRSS
jgi:predicted phosphodiesterase